MRSMQYKIWMTNTDIVDLSGINKHSGGKLSNFYFLNSMEMMKPQLAHHVVDQL